MSSIAANVGSVPSPAPDRAGAAAHSQAQDGNAQRSAARRQLLLRVASALVLVPLALLAVYFGFPWFELLVAVLAAAMALEWSRLTLGSGWMVVGGAMAAGAILSIVVASVGRTEHAFGLLALALLVVVGSAAILRERNRVWAAVGTLYVAIPCLAVVWLRGQAPAGRSLLVWLLLVVWTTDIAAYAVGRTVGGPRLAPRISPGKTWSGLIGGIAGAALVSAAAAAWLDLGGTAVALALGALLAAVAQAGDLAESGVKRVFGVKDSGHLIPGHGGVLDRLDGMLTAAPAAAAIIWLAGGGLPAWR